MFSDLISAVQANGRGIHAFRKAADTARARAAEHGDQAAAWFLLASIAERIVDRNERMAVTSAESNQWFDELNTAVERLNTAFASGDATARLDAINQTARTLADPAA